jgi:hypothetical protein
VRGADPDGKTELDEDAAERRRLIDALMSGPPAGLPSIMVVGDDDIFGIRPLPQAGPDPRAPRPPTASPAIRP